MKTFKFPNTLVIMIGFILFVSILTFIIPHGAYERVIDPITKSESIVPGSYHTIEAESISILDIIITIPEGIIGRADLIALIFLIGGCFYVIDKTGALKEGVIYLSAKVRGREEFAIIVVSLLFATAGALVGLQEEIIAMTPVLLLLSKRLGYNAYVAISISYGAAIIGAAFSPVNPFAVVIAQRMSNLPLLSGSIFRLIVLVIAVVLWIILIIRYANKNKVEIEAEQDANQLVAIGARSKVILSLVALTFAVVIYGQLTFDWGFNEMSGFFFVLGILVGIIGKLGLDGTSKAYIEGFKEMTFASIIVGLAYSISLVLQKGVIIDSIIYGLFLPVQYLPKSLSAILMMVSHTVLHLPLPSYSGQAILTMPILAPLSDLIGFSRQVCVLAYQYGAVMADLIILTNGALMAVLAIAGISFNQWIKFVMKLFLIILAFSAVVLAVAVFIEY